MVFTALTYHFNTLLQDVKCVSAFKLARCHQGAKQVEFLPHDDNRVFRVITVQASSLKTKLVQGNPWSMKIMHCTFRMWTRTKAMARRLGVPTEGHMGRVAPGISRPSPGDLFRQAKLLLISAWASYQAHGRKPKLQGGAGRCLSSSSEPSSSFALPVH